MAIEIELLKQVVAELTERISGARIDKIYQPAAELLILRLWNGRENLRLLISADPRQSRIHLTKQSFPNPFTPPRFCQLLRARLSRIIAVRQLNEDRIVELDCQGPKGDCRLLVELTGRSSNLVLIDAESRVIDTLKRQEGERIRPGAVYLLPEAPMRTPVEKDLPDTAKHTASELVESLYGQTHQVSGQTDLKSRLEQLLNKQRKKLNRRMKNIRSEHQRQQGYEGCRQQGELLLANLHLLKKGMTQATLLNYYLQPPLEQQIELDSTLSPQENAERYFRSYKKARRGLEHSQRRLTETEMDLQWLEQLAYQLSTAENPEAVTMVADELKTAKLLKEKVSRLPMSHREKHRGYREAFSPAGFKVLWGNNSRQNDQLSTRQLKKNDLWFHAHQCPGSHVLLKADSARGDFSEEDIRFAASIAATNSRAGQDAKVEVIVAEAGQVLKPAGAKPGMVTVKKYRTMMVKPFVEKSKA